MDMDDDSRIHAANPQKRVYRKDFLDRIPTLRLLDDDFFTACFQDNLAAVELVLRIILEKDDLNVTQAETQYYIDDLKGHSVRLDAFATDSTGIRYDIEVQRSNAGAIPKRARYNSSLIDAQTLRPGDDYSLLPESYVIFITEHDVLHQCLPICHIDRTIRETGAPFEDGSHIVYVSAANRDDTPLGQLMEDFCNTEPKEMHYSVLTDATKYFKYDNEGVSYMCDFWEELIKEGREQGLEEGRAEGHEQGREQGLEEGRRLGFEEGREQGRREAEALKQQVISAQEHNRTVKNVLRMIKDGLQADKIVAYSGMPREEVEELIALVAG